MPVDAIDIVHEVEVVSSQQLSKPQRNDVAMHHQNFVSGGDPHEVGLPVWHRDFVAVETSRALADLTDRLQVFDGDVGCDHGASLTRSLSTRLSCTLQRVTMH